MKKQYKYLEADIVNSIKASFSSREVVEGSITGLHKSPYQGYNIEFAQHREYIPGDELKNLDWKVYARTDKLYIKQYEEETDLRAYFLLDTSRSMRFSTNHAYSKYDYAAYMTAALTYFLHKQGDSVGLALLNAKVDTFIPPRATTSHCDLIFKTLERQELIPKTSLASCLHEIAERIKKRGVIFIFSDLYDNLEDLQLALRHFRFKKHEVILFHLLDPQELSLDFKGETYFIDYETGEKLIVNPKDILEDYQAEMKKFTDFFKKLANEIGLTYWQVDISTPYKLLLQQFLQKRLKGRI
jgi:uncharacterized protein (DUF58 family)